MCVRGSVATLPQAVGGVEQSVHRMVPGQHVVDEVRRTMTKYQVTIEAVIRKTYEVEADTAQKAQEQAHGLFTVEPEGGEYYDQQAIDTEEITSATEVIK